MHRESLFEVSCTLLILLKRFYLRLTEKAILFTCPTFEKRIPLAFSLIKGDSARYSYRYESP